MRALVTESYGATPVVREVPDPVAGPGEVLVRIAAASFNPFDRAVAAGLLKDRMEHRFPVILGRDYAGTIAASGEPVQEDPGRFAMGDRVFGIVTSMALGPGTVAELIAAPAAYAIVPVPAGLDLDAAAALGLAGAAAISAVDAVDPKPGETVLVSGATGGVGSLAVQLIVARGATVIATANSDAGRALVRDLGAGQVVDYGGDVLVQVRSIEPNGVDAIVHLAGDGIALADLLVPGGRIASLVGLGPDSFPGRDLTAFRAMADPAGLPTVAELAGSGALRARVTRTFTLDEAPRLFTDPSRTLGKSVIRIG